MQLRFATVLLLAIAAASCAAPARPDAATAASRTAAYNRNGWHHWVDADVDCQDTREEVLIAESEVPVTYRDSRHCHVASGRWTCAYTGKVFSDPGDLDIDHMVPLENAHSSGGAEWSREKKESYANALDEPEHLVAVAKSANRSKGSKGPEQWLPPNEANHCQYAADWKAIKKRWRLKMNRDEKKTIEAILENCGR